MPITDLINTTQRFTMYADWVPVVNWYSPIARVPVAVSQLATGAFKDGTLNLCRSGVFYLWVRDKSYKDINATNIFHGLIAAPWFIGFDISRANTTAEHILSLGVPNPLNIVDPLVGFANRWCLVPVASTVTSFPARLLAGSIQSYAGSAYYAGSKMSMITAKLLGQSELLELAKINFRVGSDLTSAGLGNCLRAMTEFVPLVGNFCVWGLE